MKINILSTPPLLILINFTKNTSRTIQTNKEKPQQIGEESGCVHMLIYNARVWHRLRALVSYKDLGLTNHSVFFKRGYFINCNRIPC